ncbi:MAG: HNH endonuclease [Peptoniphilus sp.]|uniref:HNH endonuclease n=1 Tax=Peptoniphilus sp. TaxID=1971214 RepID=UPI002A748323|nr:HNH endonuclease [Peptoniphilus sp.]MDY2986123.1 HNH endonuclease [Peptoniphilus sp.]
MNNYNRKKWKVKASVIKKRDNYECQECKRRGIKTDAECVHHINPAKDRPDLFWDNKNLISLCNNCHGKMHNRHNDTLTKLGRWYKNLYLRGGSNMLTKIRFIVGAPCSGKSTYVREHAGKNDIVFDYDEIVKALSFNDLHNNNPNMIDYVLDIRDLILKRLEMEDRFDTAWIITTWMPESFYNYYLYAPEVIKMTTGKEECLKRLINNPEKRNFEENKRLIEEYFQKKAPL